MTYRRVVEQHLAAHIHILLKQEAPRIFANVVGLFEIGMLAAINWKQTPANGTLAAGNRS
jgi:hypothetical protein